MAFTNKINKEALKDALINWVLGTDGNDGATEYVMDEIPWSEEMGFDYWDEVVCNKIDSAIGSRYDGGIECWEVSKLVQDLDYHGRFLKFIDKKVEDIYNTYQKCIDGIEKYREKTANNSGIYTWTVEKENKMKKFIVVSCEHSEKTEEPYLCATFNTRTAAEDYIENAILKSLDEFKDEGEERLDDNGVVIYDENGVIEYSCIWTILEVAI